jgi:GTPase SAR1 family protein
MTDIKDRLHVIWLVRVTNLCTTADHVRICLEVNSSRTQQVAYRKLYKAVSQNAKDVPIVVVATKKDEFLGAKTMDARKLIEIGNKSVVEYLAALDNYAETEFRKRMELIERELLEIEGGRFDAIVSITKGEQTVSSDPSKLTSHR